MKKSNLILLILALAFAFSSCFGADDKIKENRRELFAMDTYMSLLCYGDGSEKALKEAEDEILRLDGLLSTGKADSEISALNSRYTAAVSVDTFEIIKRAAEICASTGGAFDITVYPLMKLWGFTDSQYKVPTLDEIAAALYLTGSDKITLDAEKMTVKISKGQGIDLGGIAKGYTSDRLMKIFAVNSVSSACVSLGGNVQCLGCKPDGTPWRCGIRDPFSSDENALSGVVEISDKAVVTSGPYQRYFTDEETGKRYHHIIDPANGMPAESGLASVSVICSEGMTADALSSAFFVMGKDKAVEYWKACGAEFDMVFVTEDKTVFITEGLMNCFTSDYRTVIIYKE